MYVPKTATKPKERPSTAATLQKKKTILESPVLKKPSSSNVQDSVTPSTDSSVKMMPKQLELSPESFTSGQDAEDPHMPAGAVNSTEEREHIDYNGETKVIIRKRYEMADGSVNEVKYLEDLKT